MTQSAARPLAIALLLIIGAAAMDGSESLTPLGRETTDRQADLQRRLLDSGMANLAQRICRRRLADLQPGSEESAQWTIRLSQAMIQHAVEQRPIDPAAWQRTAELLDNWLIEHESSQRVFWVQLARAMVDYRRSQVAALSVLATPENGQLREAALAALRASEERLTQLAAELEQSIPLADLKRDKNFAPAAELRVVLGTVQRQLVRTLLARAELYPPESDDALAAASRAANQADELLRKTAADDARFADIVRLLAESWLHVGDTPKAATALQALMPADRSADSESTDTTGAAFVRDVVPQTRALLVRIALADHQYSRARQWLDAYYAPDNYNKDAQTAPPPLDLARLEFLLSGQQPDIASAADWAEAIEARHGAFYGRMASLKLIGLGDANSAVDPRVLAANAAAMLRRSEYAAAAGQFAEAAQRAAALGETENAFTYRLQGAASYRKAKDLDRASELLTAASRELPDHRLAEAAHLQAALLLMEAGEMHEPARVDRYRKILIEQLKLWPDGSQAQQSRQLLSRLLKSRRQWAAAARLWTDGAIDAPRAAALWRKALRASRDDMSHEDSRREALLDEAVELLPTAGERAMIVALWADRPRVLTFRWEELAESLEQQSGPAAKKGRFAFDVAQLRLGKSNSPDSAFLSSDADEPWTMDLILRLGRDARDSAADRSRLGPVIAALAKTQAQAAESRADQAAILSALVNSDQSTAAVELTDRFPTAHSGSVKLILSRLLLSAPSQDAKRQGIDLLTRVGRGLRKGSDQWFAVQLEICEAHRALDQRSQAAKLAKYLLISSPPSDPQQLARLKQLAAES